ncbi:hypothetical protein AHAS_Ahas09G0202300 [Arachis hypogaea]
MSVDALGRLCQLLKVQDDFAMNVVLNMDSDPEEDILLEDDQVLIGEEHGGNEDDDDEMIDSVKGNNE